jgi:hypothetical protein
VGLGLSYDGTTEGKVDKIVTFAMMAVFDSSAFSFSTIPFKSLKYQWYRYLYKSLKYRWYKSLTWKPSPLGDEKT